MHIRRLLEFPSQELRVEIPMQIKQLLADFQVSLEVRVRSFSRTPLAQSRELF